LPALPKELPAALPKELPAVPATALPPVLAAAGAAPSTGTVSAAAPAAPAALRTLRLRISGSLHSDGHAGFGSGMTPDVGCFGHFGCFSHFSHLSYLSYFSHFSCFGYDDRHGEARMPQARNPPTRAWFL
jgi:hypothetical protein